MDVEEKKPKIFLIAGKARHGKDTVAEMILDEYNDRNKKGVNLALGSYIKMYAQKISNWDGNDETKPRELLQYLGTDVIRKKIDDLFFVNRICEDIKVYSYFFDIITVSDVRFVCEIEIPEAMFENVIKIKVERPNVETNLTEKEKKHQSEIDLDNYTDYDYVIKNDGSLDELKNKVHHIIEVIENEH